MNETTMNETIVPLQVGQQVQMLVEVGEHRFVCEASVIDLQGSVFETSAPHCYGVRIPVREDRLHVTLTMPHALFSMPCAVISSEDDRLTLEIPDSEAVQVTQRRQYPRFPVSQGCSVELNFENDGCFWPPAPAHLKDVSEGGCGFLFALELMPGMQARISLDVPDRGTISLLGRVRHCKPVHAATPLPYHVGIEFEDSVLDASRFAVS